MTPIKAAPGGIPKAKGLSHPRATPGKYQVMCAIPVGWEVAFLKRRGKPPIVIAAHEDSTSRWSPLRAKMRPFQQWPVLTLQKLQKEKGDG